MEFHWIAFPAGLMLMAVAVWHGYTSYTSPVESAASPHPSSLQADDQLQDDSISRSCQCQDLPLTLRARRLLHRLYPPPASRRSDDSVPDLTQLSTAELQELLGLPEDIQPTTEEIQELQDLITADAIPIELLQSVSEQVGDYIDEDYADYVLEEVEVGEETSTIGATTASHEEQQEVDKDSVSSRPSTTVKPKRNNGASSSQSDRNKNKNRFKTKDKDKHKDNNKRPADSGFSFLQDIGFDDSVIDAVGETIPSDIPFVPLHNPFPNRPFPQDYADISHHPLGSDYHDTLSSESFYHPVRTFKFRLLLPTFMEFFGFQFASQTILEMYVAKVPGPNQRTGIPDAFYERKYWNVLVEMDGNKVISTLPEEPYYGYDEPQSQRDQADTLNRRSGPTATEPVNRRRTNEPPPGAPTQSVSRRRTNDPPPGAPTQSVNRRRTSIPPSGALFGNYDSTETRRLMKRQRLKYEAENAFVNHMTPERYQRWVRENAQRRK